MVVLNLTLSDATLIKELVSSGSESIIKKSKETDSRDFELMLVEEACRWDRLAKLIQACIDYTKESE